MSKFSGFPGTKAFVRATANAKSTLSSSLSKTSLAKSVHGQSLRKLVKSITGKEMSPRGTADFRRQMRLLELASASETWVPVVFDGTNDYLTKTSAAGVLFSNAITYGYCTMAVRFKRNAAATMRFFDSGVSASTARIILAINTSGVLTFTFIDSTNGKGVNSGTIASTLGTWGGTEPFHTLHIANSFDGSGTTRIFLDGVENASSPLTWSLTAQQGINLGGIDTAAIGSTIALGSKINADVSMLWIGAGNTSNYYITDPAKFWVSGSDPTLGSDGSGAGATPQVFFGGTMPVADWNAGANRGTGGTFTKGGSTDIVAG